MSERVPTNEHDDATIQADVRYELGLAPELDGAAIYAGVAAATVTLSGVVEDYPQRDAAARCAARVRGVRKVENRLKLRPEWGTEHDSPATEFKAKADADAASTPPFKLRDAL
jgi:hypothetical protein